MYGIKKLIFKEKKILNYFQIFLICVLPPALISGPFLPDLCIVLVSLIYLYICFKYKSWNSFRNPISIIFFVWCMYLIISSLFSNNILLSLESSLFFFRFGIFALAIGNLIIEHEKELIKFLSISLVSTFSILLFDALFQYFLGFNLLLFEYEINRFARLKGLFGDESILGSYLVRLLPILFAVFVYKNNQSKLSTFFFCMLVIAIDVVIFLSGERTAFGLLFVFMLIFIFLLKDLKFLKIILIIIPIISITIISLTNTKIKNRMIDYTIDQVNKSYIFSQEHDLLILHAYDIFLQNKIFGVGTKMFREECKLDKYNSFNQKEMIGINKGLCNTHPHNYLIQLLSETGLVGTIPYLIIFFLILFKFSKQFFYIYFKNKLLMNNTSAALLGGIIIGIWPFFPSGNIFNNWLNVILFLNIGLFIGFSKILKNNN